MAATTGASPALVAFGIGIALAGAPGPVQAVLLTEAVRGGIGRGLRALAGVHLTFGALLVGLAVGISAASPHGLALRLLKVSGGALLLWLSADSLHSGAQAGKTANTGWALPPAVRGALAIVLNPGGWLFLGAVASPLFATATKRTGTISAVLAAVALVFGAALGDLGVVLLGGFGLRRTSQRVARLVRVVLAVMLSGLGLWLLVSGLAQ